MLLSSELDVSMATIIWQECDAQIVFINKILIMKLVLHICTTYEHYVVDFDYFEASLVILYFLEKVKIFKLGHPRWGRFVEHAKITM